jgi:hypothetical protein
MAWERREMHTEFWKENLKRPFRRPRHIWKDNIVTCIPIARQ